MTVNIQKFVILEVRHNELIRQIKILVIFLKTKNRTAHAKMQSTCKDLMTISLLLKTKFYTHLTVKANDKNNNYDLLYQHRGGSLA